VKIKIEMDITPREFQEVFIPGDKQEDFMVKTYDAYVEGLRNMWLDQVDPNNFLNRKKDD
tara:strand:+ start:637 stop:816 length:180 start_codon:yes stop_codon:yes gene_type:complete